MPSSGGGGGRSSKTPELESCPPLPLPTLTQLPPSPPTCSSPTHMQPPTSPTHMQHDQLPVRCPCGVDLDAVDA